MFNTIYCHSSEDMHELPDESVHLIVTSPPYFNARDYSQYDSYNAYLKCLDGVFKECHRVTSEGRFLAINSSPVITPRVNRSDSSIRHAIPFDLHHLLIRMGWDFIDDIVWVKPEASAKHRNGGFCQHRKPLGYKPNAVSEYIMVYRKHTDKLIDWNMAEYGDESNVDDNYETSNVWHIAPYSDDKHPAPFPVELPRRLIQLYSFKDDVVLDPFMGSGTTALAAKELGRRWVGYDTSEKYVELTNQRLRQEMLFTNF